MSNEMMAYADIKDLAISVSKAGFLGCKNPEEALSLMMLAQAEGRHPAIVQRDYHIVNGRPTLKADTVLARFQEAGGVVEYHSYTDECCDMSFSHPSGGKIRLSWDIPRANRAGVTGNPTWKKYPRAMLRARCISEGVRTIYPAVNSGTYVPEEVEDLSPVAENTVKSKPVVDIDSKGFDEYLAGLISGKYTVEKTLETRNITERAMQVIEQTLAGAQNVQNPV